MKSQSIKLLVFFTFLLGSRLTYAWDVKLESLNFVPDEALVSYTESRFAQLTASQENIISAEVYLKLDQISPSNNKHCEVVVHTSKKTYVAKAKSNDFETSVDTAYNDISNKIP